MNIEPIIDEIKSLKLEFTEFSSDMRCAIEEYSTDIEKLKKKNEYLHIKLKQMEDRLFYFLKHKQEMQARNQMKQNIPKKIIEKAKKNNIEIIDF